MSDPKGLFKMKFIGKPRGVFMRGAPGNYVHGQIYNQPYQMSRFKFWELVEEIPVLVAPELEEDESVFEEAVFIPDEEKKVVLVPDEEVDAVVEMLPVNPERGDGNPYDLNTPAIMEPYMVFNTGTGGLAPYVPPEITTTEPTKEYEITLSTVEPEGEELDRGGLIRVLDEAGVKYNKRARTATLKKLVDELVSKE